ncbi:non-ribosomal peptide synthetase, partial [Colwellia psychrerythraea]
SIHSLILDEPRPEEKQYAGARVSGQLSGDIACSLQHIAKAHQLTPFMLLHAALALVLARHSNSHDIVIGTPVANRLQAELEPLIGFFVNTLVLRLDTNHQDLSDYLAHVREVHLDAQSNQDVPFERLVEKLNISRSSAYTPVFQIMLTTDTDYGLGENKERQQLTLPGVTLSPLPAEHITAKFDLDIRISLNENGVNLEWVFDKAIFNEAHIIQFNDHLSRLLTGLATLNEKELSGPLQIRNLPVLSVQETNYLIREINDTEQYFPEDKCIHELFEAQALVTPNNIALVFEGEQLTYQALNQKANRVANYLVEQHHIIPDTLVGICVERSLDMVVGILGILKSGGAYVPLDPSYPEARLNYILSDADVSLVLTQESLLAKVGLGERQAVCLDGELLEHDPSATDQTDNVKKEALGLNSSHLAYVIYTSGSTGQPKGVAIRHSNTNAMLHWANSTFAPDELSKVLASTSLNFDLSVFELFVPLCFGYQCILVKDAFTLIEQRIEPSLINTVPSAIKVLLENKSISDSVKLINLAGEPLSTEIVNEILNNTDCTKVYNLYGPSEDTTYSTSMAFTSAINNKPGIGRVIANSQAFVLTQGLELAPFGVAGELYLSGAGVAKGYLNKPELTAERFIDNPYYDEANHNSSKSLYKTGDLVRYLPDGNLEYINRIDDQVKIRGFRIELGEIESHINKQAEVDSVLVLAKELMVGEKQLVAYVKRTAVIQTTPTANEVKEEDSTVLTDGAFITSLKEAIANDLPNYMVPSLFVIVPEWPLMPNGKINRSGLPEP